MRPLHVIRPALVLILCLLIPACKSKVSKTNFEKVKEGMTLDEVEKILGKGTKESGDGSNVAGQFGIAVPSTPTSGGGESYLWESSAHSITVTLRQGKVVHKRSTGF
jgi:hypothetical protein